jgi:zinc transport system substrate-binding protein
MAGTGAALGGVLAGCAGEGTAGAEDDGQLQAQASFFVFGDLASAVAGDTADAETLVPIGQHGHGWEPGPDLQATVFESDLFVYGMEGFQPWADDVVRNIRADDRDVDPVPVGDGVDLLGHDGEHESGEDEHETEHHDTGEHDHDDKQDHENVDPHFWLDPLRMVDALGTVTGAFADRDAENAEVYRENAEAYRQELNALHTEIADVIEGAADATVLVGGHDAFGYLQARYGIEIEALTGLSPDATPTPRDIERAQQLIADNDIEYIVADPLESQRAAEQLLAETDATEILPLTAIPGRSEQWERNDWGYVEIMREVNLPTLEQLGTQQ